MKHAYMIMAHHRIDLLQMLIDAIDDKRNDIIIHIDKKSDIDPSKLKTVFSDLYFTDRINVNWAGFSQVECEYILLRKALSVGEHSYYHFVTGVNYPLWNQDYIHDFFSENKGTEFIGFDNAIDFSKRVKFYIPFSEYGKLIGIKGKIISLIRTLSIYVQKMVGIDRLKNKKLIIKKGCAYFSITEEFAKYVLSEYKNIKGMLKYTLYGDEVFIQTLAFNSKFRNSLYSLDNEWSGSMREFAWPSNISGVHPGWNFSMTDLDYLLSSDRIFAMKFEGNDGIEVEKIIRKKKKI